MSDAPPASKPPDALGDTVFASGQQSGASTKISPGQLQGRPRPSRRWMLAIPIVIAGGALAAVRFWPHATGPTVQPPLSVSVPVSSFVVVVPAPPDAGPVSTFPCTLDPRPIAPVHGNVQSVSIGTGSRLFSIGARATVTTDGGRRMAPFIGTLDPLGKGDLHPPKLALLDEGDVWTAATSIRGAPQFVFFQNHSPDEPRGGSMMSLPVAGDFGPGTAVSNAEGEATDLAASSFAHELLAIVVGKSYPLRGSTPTSTPTGWAVKAWMQSGTPAVLKDFPPESKDPPRGPAAAVGHDCRAAAWRTAHQIHVAWLATEPKIDAAIDLGAGDVGAPTIAIQGDVMTIVWAERASAMEAYRLHFATWHHGTASPTSPKTLETGFSSAVAPAVAVSAHRTALAWMEEESGTSRVRIGIGSDIEAAAKNSRDASATGVKAGDPELAVMGDDFGLIWIEHPAMRGEARAAVATCK